MSELERYDIIAFGAGNWMEKKETHGLYVSAEDALRLERERDEAQRDLAAARAEIARLTAELARFTGEKGGAL